MIRQQFLRRFKPKLVTVLKVFGPILTFQLLGMAREHYRYPPLGIEHVLLAAGGSLLAVAGALWLWALGEWSWLSLRRFRIFWGELWKFSRNYWKSGAAAATK
jgi:hypothetical protein